MGDYSALRTCSRWVAQVGKNLWAERAGERLQATAWQTMLEEPVRGRRWEHGPQGETERQASALAQKAPESRHVLQGASFPFQEETGGNLSVRLSQVLGERSEKCAAGGMCLTEGGAE